jgi:glutathione synthase
VAKYKLLVLTDHSAHLAENTVYPLVRELLKDSRCQGIDVASRGNELNRLFFEKMALKSLYASTASHTFGFAGNDRFFKKDLIKVGLRSYDAVLLRIPHPVASGFWQFLAQEYPHVLFINAPKGIEHTGSKEYLLQFPQLCPPLRLCRYLDEIADFKNNYPIVLKPLHSYGGQGILKIDGDKVSKSEGGDMSWGEFAAKLQGKPVAYLGTKFLENVHLGDKRIVVCKGQVLGAALRTPPKGSWICNVAMGGKSSMAQPDEDEMAIIRQIDPHLASHGIIFYGIDTLVGDDGKRVLSEINTTSIGGLPKIAEYSGKPVVGQAAGLLLDYIEERLMD